PHQRPEKPLLPTAGYALGLILFSQLLLCVRLASVPRNVPQYEDGAEGDPARLSRSVGVLLIANRLRFLERDRHGLRGDYPVLARLLRRGFRGGRGPAGGYV